MRLRHALWPPHPILTGAVALLIAAGGLGANAASRGSEIDACVENATGAVRLALADSPCTSAETATSWNIPGPAGDRGPTGPRGDQGPAGFAGARGADGTKDAPPSLFTRSFDSTSKNSDLYDLNLGCPKYSIALEPIWSIDYVVRESRVQVFSAAPDNTGSAIVFRVSRGVAAHRPAIASNANFRLHASLSCWDAPLGYDTRYGGPPKGSVDPGFSLQKPGYG